MTTKTLRIGAAAACLTTFGYLAYSVAQPPAAQPVPGQPAAAANHYRATQVLGSKVSLQGNAAGGTVQDIVFDDAGNLEYLVVAEGDKLVTVPWEAVRFNTTERVAVVNVTADQYRAIPRYTATTYPAYYTPAYRTEIYKSYNLTPRDLRRLDRRTDR